MDNSDITMEEYIELEAKKLAGVVRRLIGKLLPMTDSKNDNDEVNISSDDVYIEQSNNGIDANIDTQSHKFKESFDTNHDTLGSLRDKIICDLNKTPDLSQRPPQNFRKCRNPVDGHYYQGCALVRKKFKEDLFTYCIENGIFQDASEPSNDNTNVVNALQEPFVVKHDPGSLRDKIICDLNKTPDLSQRPPQNFHASEPSNDNTNVVNALQDPFVFKHDPGAHYGYNCPSKVSIIPDPKPFNNQTVDELPQTLPSFDPTCYSEDENLFTYDSKSNIVDDSPNVFNPPPQTPIYSYEFCGNDAYYGHDCSL
nr:hypothetical protein [Tanacetum cinerariifolium]